MIEQKAPEGKYRVIQVDTFDNTECLVGDYKKLHTAIKIANEKGGTMSKVHIYNSLGSHLYEAGIY